MRDVPKSYLDYADERRILITSTEDIFGPVTEVFAVSVPGEAVEDPQEIPRFLLSHVYGTDGYTLNDRRCIAECGASGASQEVMLAVASGVAGSLATIVVDQVRLWLKRQKADIQLYDCGDESLISQAFAVLEEHFKTFGELTILETTKTEEHLKLLIRDASDVRWDCSVEISTRSVSAKLHSRSSSSEDS